MTSDAAPQAARPEIPVKNDVRLELAWEAVARPDIRVMSTDVFDTLLWRQVAEPFEAFALLAERLQARGRLAAHLSPEAFQNLRRLAEQEARSRRAFAFNDLEPNLEEIYELVPDYVFRHSIDRRTAMDTELALERQLCVPDLDVVELLVAASAAGKTVVAVTDTYFSELQIRHLLDQPGVGELRVDRVFTSSDHRRGKSAGLFQVVLDSLDVPPGAAFHLGDHSAADIEPAQELGIDALLFDRHPEELHELLRLERRFAGPRPRAGPGSSLPVELTALRGKVATRAERRLLPPSLQPFWNSGALVHGPVMTGFAEWVQARATEVRAERLYCLMREGAFLTRLLNRAGAYMGLPVRAFPLWLNREVLASATVAEASSPELESLLARRTTPTIAQFMAGVGLTFGDLPRFASHAHTRLDDPIMRQNLLASIEDDEVVRAKVLAHSRALRNRIVRYVEQLLDGARRLVVVDLGWAASAQLLLRHALALAGRDIEVVGFYLLTHEGAARCVFFGMRASGYLGDLGVPERDVKTIVRTPEILEQICMPEHGSQVGLDETFEPILGPSPPDRTQALEAATVRHGIESFQREWARYQVVAPGKLPSMVGAADLLRPLLIRQLAAPTPTEAALFGSWAHDENQGSERTHEIADFRLGDRLRHLGPHQLQELPMAELYWPAGLAARVDPSYSGLFAAGAAGELAWDTLGSDLESGPFSIEIGRGVDVHPESRLLKTTQRNHFGLSMVAGSLEAGAIQELVIRPSSHPCVLRLDFLEVRCHVQGSEDPILLTLQGPGFAQLTRVNCFVLNPNVFVVHGSEPSLHLDLSTEIPHTIFRVDMECGLAVLPIGQVLPTSGRLRSVEEAGVELDRLEGLLDGMRNSLSWRLTRPLRLLKRSVS